jgi:hypothetical protein
MTLGVHFSGSQFRGQPPYQCQQLFVQGPRLACQAGTVGVRSNRSIEVLRGLRQSLRTQRSAGTLQRMRRATPGRARLAGSPFRHTVPVGLHQGLQQAPQHRLVATRHGPRAPRVESIDCDESIPQRQQISACRRNGVGGHRRHGRQWQPAQQGGIQRFGVDWLGQVVRRPWSRNERLARGERELALGERLVQSHDRGLARA